MEISHELLRVMEKQVEQNALLTGEVSQLREQMALLTGKLSNGTLGSISSCVSENSKKLTSLQIIVVGMTLTLMTMVGKMIIG